MPVEIGDILSKRYRVEKLLGHGGMADVYLVYDMEASVHLALKLLKEDLAEDVVFIRRFKREAQTLAHLQHPNIVRFYAMEENEGLVFMIMDYVDGTTLRKELFLRKKPFTLDEIIAILRPVCAALNFAHLKQMVHCDVKPANIMIEKTGRVLLADFGIARISEGATTATMVGVGTPAYMAPEQILGQDPVPQTDIYALGIVLYEMLTGGERPFTGEIKQTTGSTSEKVRWEQLHSTPPSPRKYNQTIPPEVEAVVMRCLEKEPSKRFRSAMDVLYALQSVDIKAQPAQLYPMAETKRESAPVPPQLITGAQQSNVAIPPDQLKLKPKLDQPQRAIPPVLPVNTAEQPPRPRQRKSWPAQLTITVAAIGILILFAGIFLIATLSNGNFLSNLTKTQAIQKIGDINSLYFTSNRSGSDQIYSLSSNGVIQITNSGSSNNWEPLTAMNGSLYFTSDRSGKDEVYMLTNKSAVIRVTNSPDKSESWNPAIDLMGNLYFASDRPEKTVIYIQSSKGIVSKETSSPGKTEIYLLNSKGVISRVTNSPAKSESWEPAPALNGILFFTSNRSGKREVYSLNRNSKVIKMTNSPGQSESWNPAPDSTGNLYFTSNRSGKNEIYMLDSQGKVVKVTNSPGKSESWDPYPSLDGSLYFTSDRSGKDEVYCINSRGVVVQTTNTSGTAVSFLSDK